MNTNIIECKNLSIGYENNIILSELNLDFKKSEFHSIIGPNGCGKTTFLKTLVNQIRPIKGDIFLNGNSIKNMVSDIRASSLSAVFQFDSMIPGFSITEFLKLHTYPLTNFRKSIPFSKVNDLIDYSIQKCEISLLLDKKLNQISSGELQLVQIAGAIIQNKNIIILDEPIAHLDPGHSLKIMQLLKDLNNEGSTIITVMHDINFALNFSDIITVFNKGQNIFTGTTEELHKSSIFDSTYNIKSLKENISGKKYFLF